MLTDRPTRGVICPSRVASHVGQRSQLDKTRYDPTEMAHSGRHRQSVLILLGVSARTWSFAAFCLTCEQLESVDMILAWSEFEFEYQRQTRRRLSHWLRSLASCISHHRYLNPKPSRPWNRCERYSASEFHRIDRVSFAELQARNSRMHRQFDVWPYSHEASSGSIRQLSLLQSDCQFHTTLVLDRVVMRRCSGPTELQSYVQDAGCAASRPLAPRTLIPSWICRAVIERPLLSLTHGSHHGEFSAMHQFHTVECSAFPSCLTTLASAFAVAMYWESACMRACSLMSWIHQFFDSAAIPTR